MSIVRYTFAVIITATMGAGAFGALAIADQTVYNPAPPAATAQSVAAGRIVPVQTGAGLDLAVSDALDATRIAAAAAQKRADDQEMAEREAVSAAPKLSCEPDADARLVGNMIVNKACPELNALKEQAQREYAEQLRSPNADTKPSEAEQRRRIANGTVGAGGGYEPGSANYQTCLDDPVADVCGG